MISVRTVALRNSEKPLGLRQQTQTARLAPARRNPAAAATSHGAAAPEPPAPSSSGSRRSPAQKEDEIKLRNLRLPYSPGNFVSVQGLAHRHRAEFQTTPHYFAAGT